MRLLPAVLATLLLLGACATSAAAEALNVPSPSTSTVPTYLQLCPAGDLSQRVVVRDIAGAPITGAVVELDFCACAGVRLCPPLPGDPYVIVSGCKVRMVTDAVGAAAFPIRGGGVCAGSVPVSADGITLAIVGLVVSPDQNASLAVDAVDSGILGGKLGLPDPTGDLNGSGGLVDAADAAILTAHLGHACSNPTPAYNFTWGKLKQTYR